MAPRAPPLRAWGSARAHTGRVSARTCAKLTRPLPRLRQTVYWLVCHSGPFHCGPDRHELEVQMIKDHREAKEAHKEEKKV